MSDHRRARGNTASGARRDHDPLVEDGPPVRLLVGAVALGMLVGAIVTKEDPPTVPLPSESALTQLAVAEAPPVP